MSTYFLPQEWRKEQNVTPLSVRLIVSEWYCVRNLTKTLVYFSYWYDTSFQFLRADHLTKKKSWTLVLVDL